MRIPRVRTVWGLRPLLIVLLLSLLFSCNQRISQPEDEIPPEDAVQIPAFGQATTLEIATWNLETFPKLGGKTVEDVVQIVQDLQVDLYAVQEITDAGAFRNLYQNLPHHLGKLANFQAGGNLLTGVLYDTTVLRLVADTILFDNDYDFPRPAYMTTFVSLQEPGFDFHLIVLHLKAFGDPESEARRRRAVQKLKNFLDAYLTSGGDPDVVLAGDWNDLLTDPPEKNIFLPFLTDSASYCFFTDSLARTGTEYTFIEPPFSFLDHLAAARHFKQSFADYVVEVLKIENYFQPYLNEVSDHRPVAVRLHPALPM